MDALTRSMMRSQRIEPMGLRKFHEDLGSTLDSSVPAGDRQARLAARLWWRSDAKADRQTAGEPHG